MFKSNTFRIKEMIFLTGIIFLSIIFFSEVTSAQSFGSIKKGVQINVPQKTYKAILDPLPAGTYTIGTGGYFATIQAAFNKLSEDGIAGPVTLELIDNLYVAQTDSFGFKLIGPIPGAGPTNRVIIKPEANKNVNIEGSGFTTVSLYNTSYVTIDGISTTGSTTLTILTHHNADFSFNDGIDFCDNSDHNVMQNIIFINEDYTRASGSGFIAWQGSIGAPDSNLIQNNFTKQAGIAHYFDCYYATIRSFGNIISNNRIGSENDSLIGFGISVAHSFNSIIENNIIQNLKSMNNTILNCMGGIWSYWGTADIIRNNIVHNLKTQVGFTCAGIVLAGDNNNLGTINKVYNNIIYDISSTSSSYSFSRVAGIDVWYQSYPEIYYNTIYLSGIGGFNPLGSSALFIPEATTNLTAKNNIFVNTRNEALYCASLIYNYSSSNGLNTNFNDLYYNANSYNCLARTGGTEYTSLLDWQATGNDLNSISEIPNFVSANDLHINPYIVTLIDSHATPIPEIIYDFEGNARDSNYPDIGADEFDWVLPVELTSFNAISENNSVIIRWQTASELNNNGFEIQRKVAESDFSTIGFVQGSGTTTNPNDYTFTDKNISGGKYFYRLKQIDFNGTYEYSNVIEVEVRSLEEYALEQNYPNPLNPTTTIGYVLKEKTTAKLLLLNAIGEEIAILVNQEQDKGFHRVNFNAANLPSGVYFYQLKAGEFISTKKMLLLK